MRSEFTQIKKKNLVIIITYSKGINKSSLKDLRSKSNQIKNKDGGLLIKNVNKIILKK